ncbi:hypothetical protein MFIFM68171_00635 [Madurella fahalii]|uniref:Uncharacterized protein n=1 Tax=Madurella fahalii TaxID=1157608 RepID=A0ABQ0FYM8_9PEZI
MDPAETLPKPQEVPNTGVDAKPAEAAADGANNGNGNPSRLPPPSSPSSSASVADSLAQALRDLARGEQTATTLEANLTDLEGKLDAILASLGVSTDDEGPAPEQDTRQTDGKAADGEKRS